MKVEITVNFKPEKEYRFDVDILAREDATKLEHKMCVNVQKLVLDVLNKLAKENGIEWNVKYEF
jgi:hypothetical protein